MRTNKRQTGKTVVKDAQGKEYTLVTITTFINVSGMGSARRELPGEQEFFVSTEQDGMRVSKDVKRISKGVYQIVGSEVELRSDAPDAP